MANKKYHVVQHKETGEINHVLSLEGYEDWNNLGSHIGEPKHCEEWDLQSGKLKLNVGKKEKHDRETKACDPLHLMERIEALEAKVELLMKGK